MAQSESPTRDKKRPSGRNSGNGGKKHVFDTELIRAHMNGSLVQVWLPFPVGFADSCEEEVTFAAYVEHVDTFAVKFCIPATQRSGEPRIVWVPKNVLCVSIDGAEPTKETAAKLDS